MIAKPSAPVGREGRRVYALQHQMLASVNKGRLAAGIASPQHKHQMLSLTAQCTDGCISKGLPPFALMTACLMRPHRKCGIEQQHTLLCPTGKIARGWHRNAQIIGYLLKDIDERGRHRHTICHRETQSVGLSGLVIGVLPYDHHLNL